MMTGNETSLSEICRFGDSDPVVVRVELSAGCLCFPDDKTQDLCEYHYYKASPQGEMKVTVCRIPDCKACKE